MIEKEIIIMERVKQIFNSVIFAGVIIMFIGGYFYIIKAGLPYQDPTEDMIVRWSAYAYAGKICLSYGSVICFVGLVGKIICKILIRKRQVEK